MSCRLCLKRGETMISIFPNKYIQNNIKSCLALEITEEKELPNKICTQCNHKLEEFSSFKNFSLTVDRILRNAKLSGNLLFAGPSFENDAEDQDSVSKENQMSDSDSSPEEIPVDQNFYSPEDFKCYVCGEIFLYREDLLGHVKSHLSPLGRIEDKKSENLETRKGRNANKEKIKCPVCALELFPQSLRNHMNKHSDRFRCDVCLVRCATRATLEVHKKSLHTNIKDHICSECGKQFAHMSLLQVHMKSHGDVRLYKCKLCDYAGKTGQALRRHNQSHLKERTHLCDMCPKTFCTGIKLRLHKRRVHLDERKHCCDQCGLGFFKKSTLRDHLRIHTGEKPFNCDICRKEFRTINAFTEHSKVHKKVVKKCSECEMEFRTLKSFQRHACGVK